MVLRNQVVFAPAGSGKTERLSNRYIELLQAGVKPERILTLTFTEKAAAEMKERIFQRLAERDQDLHRFLRQNALRMRVSTIHSFCLELVRRFAPTLSLDPRVEVLADTAELWNAVKYDVLMTIAESERSAAPDGRDADAFNLLLDLITRDERPGWPRLAELYDRFFEKRVNIARAAVRPVDRAELARARDALRRHPMAGRLADAAAALPRDFAPSRTQAAVEALAAQADAFLTKSGDPRRPRGKGKEEERELNELFATYYGLLRQDRWAAEFARSFELFRERFLDAYTRRKRASGQVDYDDMEYLALQLLVEDQDWQNVLRAFDEHTDHLLVDEFQDTSFLQWGIIDKLTEEWRSGEGVKQAKDVEPTVFLVGDDKQSIYMFRDAKVEVFGAAADRLEQWLGPDRLERVNLRKNYRSLQAIIDFSNALFSKLMAPAASAQAEPWRTHYAPFVRARENPAPGRVEILLDRFEGKADERRQRDAANVCRRILNLLDPANPFPVFERTPDNTETHRDCAPRDIAILIRSRALLPALEAELQSHNIPFLVAGGAGFYAEPEVRYCIALLAALVDAADGLALYATLRGPVFGVAERDLFLANEADGLFLLDRARAAAPASALGRAVAALDKWRAWLRTEPLARVLESALAERTVWEKFWEPQRSANVRKLLRLVEDRQAAGEGPLRILRALQDAGADEAKAEVRSTGLDAVQVMTVHAAKGLQFPVVFFPGLDESIKPMREKSGQPLVIEETGPEEVLVSWIPDAGLRAANIFHQLYREKEIEEEKRVFYVACTRPRDALFLTGIVHERAERNSRLRWLVDCIGLNPDELALADAIPGTLVQDAAAVPVLQPLGRRAEPRARRVLVHRVVTPTPPRVRSISRNLPADLLRSRPEYVGIGDVVHALLEGISLGRLPGEGTELETETRRLLERRGTDPSDIERLLAVVLGQLDGLRRDPELWSIVAPRENAEAELPLLYSDGETVFSGRADRVVFDEGEIRVYDYKTFPVSDAEIPAVAAEYHDSQLFHYAAALRRMYERKKVRTFLVFTARPLVVETGLPA